MPTTKRNPKPRVRRWWAVMNRSHGWELATGMERKLIAAAVNANNGEYLARIVATPVRGRGKR
jgi:hypothetical protein